MERLTKIDKYGNPYTNENVNCRNLISEDGINYQYVGYADNFKAFDGKPIEKLSKLEDLEQELGIPLEVLFKALKDGIIPKQHFEDDELIDNKENKVYKISLVVYKLQNTIEYYLSNIRYQYGDANCGIDSGCSVELKDYGKTWALTREELENAKD